VYDVGSRPEAIELARLFLHRGQYNWFRGQVSNAHFVVPSLLRRTTNQEHAKKRLDQFFSWVGQTLGLEKIAANEMAILAVAQHYGIPTHLVDFTLDPDVAGFFSYDSPEVVHKDLESVIVCFNTEDLMEVALPGEMPKPECVVIDVTDLWRLEAQRGVFLACPYDHFEQVVYGFDRVVFPYGVPGSIDRTTIYPARKSQLEIALDHYFAEEHLARERRLLEERFKPEVISLTSQLDTSSYWSSAVEGGIDQLASWKLDRIMPWALLPDERFGNWSGRTICVDIGNLAFNRAELSTTARQMIFDKVLQQADVARMEPADWKIITSVISPEGDPVIVPQLSSALERLWDGLRTLPLRNEQIATSVANCIAFWAVADFYLNGKLGLSDEQAAKVLGQHRYVEIGGAGGYSKSYISKKGLLRALRSDMAEFLVSKFRARFMEDPSIVVEWAWKVNYLYEFDVLADLVATEIVPYQVLFRNDDPVFFSPARIERIGS
jgi:hypothetical protein